MSSISHIYSSYSEALDFSRGRFDELYTSRARNAGEFYHAFFKDLICPFNEHFSDQPSLRTIHRQIERFFGTRQIDFVAIDGTCAKDAFQDFIVFSACAYGAKGQIMKFNELRGISCRLLKADKSAMCAINRHLRLSCLFYKKP